MTHPDRFPIMLEPDIPSIPWAALAPHASQALINHNQSLERLAQRGGITPEEALAIIERRAWERMPKSGARDRLLEYARVAEANNQTVSTLTASFEPSAATLQDVHDALTLAANIRDGVALAARYNFNKLAVTLERVERRLKGEL